MLTDKYANYEMNYRPPTSVFSYYYCYYTAR